MGKFTNLECLYIDETNERTICKLIQSTSKLKEIGLYQIEDPKIMMNTMVNIFTKCPNIKYVAFGVDDNKLKDCVYGLTQALLNTTNAHQKQVIIVLTVHEKEGNVKIKDIGSYTKRIINALESCQFKDYRFGIHFARDIDKRGYSRHKIMKSYRDTHLLAVNDDLSKHVGLIISNKTCNIQGYT